MSVCLSQSVTCLEMKTSSIFFLTKPSQATASDANAAAQFSPKILQHVQIWPAERGGILTYLILFYQSVSQTADPARRDGETDRRKERQRERHSRKKQRQRERKKERGWPLEPQHYMGSTYSHNLKYLAMPILVNVSCLSVCLCVFDVQKYYPANRTPTCM